jgi:hypothetical protein
MGQSASVILATSLWALSVRESSNIMRTEELNDPSTLRARAEIGAGPKSG